MILCILWSCLPLLVVLNFIFMKQSKKENIYKKKVLIIGGGSGLGYALAQRLNTGFNKITITSRNYKFIEEVKNNTYFDIFFCDVFDDKSFESGLTSYDIIFYCTGLSIPNYFDDASVKDFEISEGTNYLGMVKILKNYVKCNTKPFDFIMIGSTLSTFPVEGYSTYSPTKSAMLSFFYSVYEELEDAGVNLHFFSPPNMQTKGFEIENRTKPEATKKLESIFSVYDPDDCAKYLIRKFKSRKIITIDWFTYFCQIRFECEKLVDYFWFPIAVIVICISKIFTRQYFKSSHT